jgi:hypothetical protein
LYWLSILVVGAGDASVAYLNLGLWQKGYMVLSSFTAMWIFEYLAVGFLCWAGARVLHKQKNLDRAFFVLAGLPIGLMAIFPSKFSI